MNTHFTLAAGLLVGTFLLPLAPAQAHGNVQWSVTVGTPGYPVYPAYPAYPSYPPPGVVVYPQSQYIYGAPPAAFSPPPVIYVQPQPAYPLQVYPPAVIRRDWNGSWHDHQHRGGDDRNRWGERHDGRRW